MFISTSSPISSHMDPVRNNVDSDPPTPTIANLENGLESPLLPILTPALHSRRGLSGSSMLSDEDGGKDTNSNLSTSSSSHQNPSHDHHSHHQPFSQSSPSSKLDNQEKSRDRGTSIHHHPNNQNGFNLLCCPNSVKGIYLSAILIFTGIMLLVTMIFMFSVSHSLSHDSNTRVVVEDQNHISDSDLLHSSPDLSSLEGETTSDGKVKRDHLMKKPKIISPSISYQVHSWNDLRQWIQGYQKGVRYFKVDVYYHIDYKDFVEKYGRACKRSVHDFTTTSTLPSTTKTSCLILTHDAPEIGGITNGIGYFDIIDLIDTVTDIRKRFKTSPNDESERIYIALCMKYHKLMFNSNAGTGTYVVGTMKNPCLPKPDNEWLILVDDMYQLFKSRTEKLGLNVEFILDESGTPGGIKSLARRCLENKWPDWPYTYISMRDPPEIMENPNEGKKSWIPSISSKTDKYNRYKYLNQPIFDEFKTKKIGLPSQTFFLEEAQRFSYGRFNELPESKLLWEPSHQQDIWKTLEVYKKKPVKKGVLRFSTNIDPIQTEVFLSKYSKYGRNEPLPNTKAAIKPKVVSIDDSDNLMFVYEKEKSLSYSFYDFHTHRISPSSVIKNNKGEVLSLDSMNVVNIMKHKISSQLQPLKAFRLVIVFNDGQLHIYKIVKNIEKNSFELGLETSVSLMNPLKTSDEILASTLESSMNTLLLFTRNTRSKVLSIYAYRILQSNEKSVTGTKLIQTFTIPNKLEKIDILKHLTIHALSLSPLDAENLPSQLDLLVLIAYSTTNNNVYGTFITLPIQEAGESKMNQDARQATLLSSPVYSQLLGVGANPSISSLRITHQLKNSQDTTPQPMERTFVSIFWGEGFCNNAEIHNVQSFPYTCSLKRLSCPNVLQYSMMSINEFVKTIQSASAVSKSVGTTSTTSSSSSSATLSSAEKRMIQINKPFDNPHLYFDHRYLLSPCKENMLFGCYDRGSDPNVLLFKHDPTLNLVSALSIHIGVPEENYTFNFGNTQPDPQQEDSASKNSDQVSENYELATCVACGDALPYDGLVLDELLFSVKLLN
ncbi:hypothetical protein C9374_014067 [Naegleria lovaniensis]|uniref:Uncharacterized protein n=1 Tax=Naegleria lovaniensis TaxID=51637 RepID=A0AA88GYN4_NAELO|nr:uncharacterized protein C9374_014067 [Naegleria lovaniensis]KAG2389507.1 hypothetical protein C9374_014067 [Naegleria lovaniensis]